LFLKTGSTWFQQREAKERAGGTTYCKCCGVRPKREEMTGHASKGCHGKQLVGEK